jgi:hypothetical protein
MVCIRPDGDPASSHLAHSAPGGDRFEPSQNSSRTRRFALVWKRNIARRQVGKRDNPQGQKKSGGKKMRDAIM